MSRWILCGLAAACAVQAPEGDVSSHSKGSRSSPALTDLKVHAAATLGGEWTEVDVQEFPAGVSEVLATLVREQGKWAAADGSPVHVKGSGTMLIECVEAAGSLVEALRTVRRFGTAIKVTVGGLGLVIAIGIVGIGSQGISDVGTGMRLGGAGLLAGVDGTAMLLFDSTIDPYEMTELPQELVLEAMDCGSGIVRVWQE